MPMKQPILFILSMLSLIPITLAQSSGSQSSAGILGLFLLLILFLILVVILSMVFWIFMIIDCAKRKFPKDDEKVVWILVLVFLGVLGAAIYYFVIKRASK